MTFLNYNPVYLISKFLKKIRLSSVFNSTVDKTAKIQSGTSFYLSAIGRYSYCGYDCDIAFCEIGAFTSLASNVVIGGARHPMEWVSMSPVFYKGRSSVRKKFCQNELEKVKKTLIGNDVWIGRSAIILPGVSVGNGAVIGAGSVVTKNIPAYAIAAGNPAKIIRYRFEETVIDRLEKIKWWEFSDDEIDKIGYTFNNIEMFLSRFD